MALNAEQIKNDLACLIESDTNGSQHRDGVSKYLLTDTLAFIQSQERQIKDLTEENERLTKEKDNVAAHTIRTLIAKARHN